MLPGTDEMKNPPRTDVKYLTVVGVLMTLIIVALAGLWVTERNRRVKADEQLAGRNRQEDAMKAFLQTPAGRQLATGEAGAGPETRPSAGLTRADIVSVKPIAWEGRNRTLVRITASAAQRLGFSSGDLVDVADGSSAAPGDGRR